MPYLPDTSIGARIVASALVLDDVHVPLAPWPLEGRARTWAAVLYWTSGRQIGCPVTAGVRAGLGYWFLRKGS